MPDIEFSSQEKEEIVQKIKKYFAKELQQEIGLFDAEFLLDFFTKEVGAYYFNRGLYTARDIVESKIQSIDEELFSVEMETQK